MRYDNLIRAIERATARYEAEVQQILRQFAKTDVDTSQALLRDLKKPTPKKARKAYVRKKLHWTQKPENKERLRVMLTKAAKAKAKRGAS